MKSQQQRQRQEQLSLGSSQSFWSLWKKIKNSIFDALFVVLDNSEDDQTMFGLITETGIDYLQMMAFPFNTTVMMVWTSNATLVGISDFINNFSITNFMPGISFNTFLALMYLLIFVIILVICDICYVVYSFSKKRFKFTLPLTLMAKCVPILVTVLFLPIMQTLLNIVNCGGTEDGNKKVLQLFPDIVCWQSWHLFHTIICMLFATIYVIISCLVALALFQPRMTTNRLTARQNSNGQVIFILNKIVCQFIFSFTPFSGTLPYCILLFLLSAWLFYVYNIAAQPYYNNITAKFFRICSSYYFWTNMMLLVSQLLNSTGFQDGLVIWLSGVIFIGITIAFQRKSNIDTLFSSSFKFKIGQQLQGHLKYVLQLYHNRNEDKNSYMLLLGYIQKHIQLCLQQDCPMKYNKDRFSSGKQEQQHSCNQLLKQVERMFAYGIKKYPECTKLRLSFAFFYLQIYQNKAKAYEHFLSALHTQPTFGEQFITYRFTKIIRQNLQEGKQNQQEDLIELIKFDNHVSLCSQGMIISSKLHRQFWSQLREQSPNLNRLNVIGARIIETSEMIHQNYIQVIKISGDGISVIQLQNNYALYLLLISHQIIAGNNLMEKVKRKKIQNKKKNTKMLKNCNQNKINDILNTKKCLLVTQFEKQQDSNSLICRIKKVNFQIIEILKYKEEEILEKKLQKILPKFMELIHDKKIESYLNKYNQNNSQSSPNKNEETISRKKKYIGQQQIGYIRQSTGYIKKVKYTVMFVPLQCRFITQMQVCPTQAIILCDSDGLVTQYTSYAKLKYPDYVSMLSIEDALGTGTINDLKDLQQKQLKIQLPGKPITLNIHLSVLQLSLIFQQDKQFEKLAHLNINNLFIPETGQQMQATVIIVKIIQLDYGINFNYAKRHKNISKSGGLDNNNIDLLNDLASTIELFYKDVEQSISQYSNTNNMSFNLRANKNQPRNEHYNLYYQDHSSETHTINFGCGDIKTYRYLNNKLIRMYFDDLFHEQSDYDYEQKTMDLQTRLSKQKIQDKNYQQRIKKALNTYIWHPQNIILLIIGFITVTFYCLLLYFISNNFNSKVTSILTGLNYTKYNIKDTNIITSSLLQVLFDNNLSNSSYSQLLNHTILFTPTNTSTIYPFLLQDNKSVKSFDLANCLIRIQANLIRAYQNSNNLKNPYQFSQKLFNVFYSYLNNTLQGLSDNFPIIDFITAQNLIIDKKIGLNKVYLSLIILLLIIFTSIWIYHELKIEFKINKILIWFLDIPLDYISFAQKQCVEFTRIFLALQKTSQSNLANNKIESQNQSKFQQHFQQYNITGQSWNQTSNTELKSQIFKNRQLLISRYAKKTPLSLFTYKQFLKIFFLGSLSIFIGMLIFYEIRMVKEVQTIQILVNTYTREYLWMCSLPIVLKINQLFRSTHTKNWKLFKQQQFTNIASKIMGNIVYTSHHIDDIKQTIYNSSQYIWIINQTIIFQYSNICTNSFHNQYLPQEQQKCKNLIRNRGQGGYSLIKQYIKQHQYAPSLIGIYKDSSGLLTELEQSLRLFVSPPLFTILKNILQLQSQFIKLLQQNLNIMIYISTISIIILFLIPWHLHLRRLNIQINQTIRTVKIVPMELIPISRKQTRNFIKWIIKQASQVQAESQLVNKEVQGL